MFASSERQKTAPEYGTFAGLFQSVFEVLVDDELVELLPAADRGRLSGGEGGRLRRRKTRARRHPAMCRQGFQRKDTPPLAGHLPLCAFAELLACPSRIATHIQRRYDFGAIVLHVVVDREWEPPGEHSVQAQSKWHERLRIFQAIQGQRSANRRNTRPVPFFAFRRNRRLGQGRLPLHQEPPLD